MTTKDKIKVVWLCHFSNREIRSSLIFSNNIIEIVVRRLLKKKIKNYKRDFAPWISYQINEFEKMSDVELHLLAPHEGMRKKRQNFIINGVSYHFFRPQDKCLLGKIKKKLIGVQNFEYEKNRIEIKRVVNTINPEIVNVIGAENPYYSIGALDITNRPLLITCQTAYSSDLFKKRLMAQQAYDYHRHDVEIKIHSKSKYFACDGVLQYETVLKNNSDAIVFKYTFPHRKPSTISLEKKYDFVFFAAALSESKGVEDLIDAFAIVAKLNNKVKLNIVGKCNLEYSRVLFNKIRKYNLDKQISFNDYFPEHSDMFLHITQARCAVLPIKLDEISGTVLEAMMLSIPVITNKTTGTPFLNKDGECVLLAEIDNIQSLADNMLKVLDNDDLLDRLSKNAKAFVDKEFDNTTSAKRLLSCYRAILNHYYNDKPIPEKLLFNMDDFKPRN